MKKHLSVCVGLSLLGFLASCASKVTPTKISFSANPVEELATQHQMIAAGYTNQVDVLAADDFKEAREYYWKAEKLNKKGASSKEVFDSLGYSKAYLEQAIKEAQLAYHDLEEVTKARQQALNAGARNFPELKTLDAELDRLSSSTNHKVSVEDKDILLKKYLALELNCIKSNKLGEVQKLINKAHDKDAEKITPKAYSEAVNKFQVAIHLIETDRHSDFPIETAVNEAKISVERVLSLLASEKTSRNQTPEQRAVALESKDNAVDVANSRTFEARTDSLVKDEIMMEQSNVIASQRASQSVTDDENTALKKNESDEKMVTDAAALFTKAEAEVYRQDGVLIIRLKSMNFASGRSDLPSDSMDVLAKVKGIIVQLGSTGVAVQGHTDSVGQAKTNQVLSEKRAESVMKYFATGEEIQSSKLSSKGFGYTKPLATNKTKAGRSQNRRVDVLITTTHNII